MTDAGPDYEDYEPTEEGFKSYLADLADDKFPFPGYRQYQDEILYNALWHLYVDGFDNIVIDGPTGIGKSPINVTIGRVTSHLMKHKAELEEHFERSIPVEDGCTFYTTPQKQLRNQLAEDEDLQMMVRMLKSRRDYVCGETGDSCADCSVRSDPNESCMDSFSCTYWNRKEGAMEADIAVLTFAMLIIDNHIPVMNEQGDQMSFKNRWVGVVDEAHGLEGQVASLFAGFKVSNLALPDEVFGDAGSKVDWDANRFADVKSVLREIALRAERFVEQYEHDETMRHKVDQCEAFLTSYNYCLTEVAQDRAWVVNVDSVELDVLANSKTIELKPVKVDRFLEQHIWSRSSKRVLSSATIPYSDNIDKWADRIGLPGETQLIRAPMPFPVAHRQIHTNTMVGEMSGDGEDRYWGDAMAQIEKIHRNHEGENGLIHCVSYSRAERVADALGHDVVMVHDEEKGADRMIQEWQQSSCDILASPSMTEGVDLHGDRCRWQALLKVPYAFVGDERVSYLLNEKSDWDWYFETASIDIQQAVGRAVRGPEPEEAASFYILDGSFSKVRKKAGFPSWFDEAITTAEPDHWDDPGDAPWRESALVS